MEAVSHSTTPTPSNITMSVNHISYPATVSISHSFPVHKHRHKAVAEAEDDEKVGRKDSKSSQEEIYATSESRSKEESANQETYLAVPTLSP